jgi:hypothetical protein
MLNVAQRLSVAAVRECEQLSCQPTPKFKRGTMLELPLKPLLLLHFVTKRIYLKTCQITKVTGMQIGRF